MNNEAIKAYNTVIINQTRENIKKLLSDNNLHYDFDVDNDGYINITIEDGDWKRDHIMLKQLMAKNGYILMESKDIGEDTGGDWYSAIHKFR